MKKILTSTLLLLLFAAGIHAQHTTLNDSVGYLSEMSLSGPRFGFTYLGDGRIYESMKERYDNAVPVISQFGYQFETRIFESSTGMTGVIEYVLLVGGLEQGFFLPSGNFILGIRTGKGFEVGMGPNISLSGGGMSLAFGKTFRAGNLFLPVNVAVTGSRGDARVSLLVGFNGRRKNRN